MKILEFKFSLFVVVHAVKVYINDLLANPGFNLESADFKFTSFMNMITL